MALLLGGYISRLKLAKLAVASKPGEKGGNSVFFRQQKLVPESRSARIQSLGAEGKAAIFGNLRILPAERLQKPRAGPWSVLKGTVPVRCFVSAPGPAAQKLRLTTETGAGGARTAGKPLQASGTRRVLQAGPAQTARRSRVVHPESAAAHCPVRSVLTLRSGSPSSARRVKAREEQRRFRSELSQ